jgi:hypothetical protein
MMLIGYRKETFRPEGPKNCPPLRNKNKKSLENYLEQFFFDL